MLLLAKDLIRRLIHGSVQLWNQEETKLKHNLQEIKVTLDKVQNDFQTQRVIHEKEEAQWGHRIDAADKEMHTARRLTLQAQIRADKMERDHLMARNELVETREKKVHLEEEVLQLKMLVTDSVWSGGKVEDLITSLKTQPLKTRRRVACAMLEIDATAGTMYMFCKEMTTYLVDPRECDSQIAMAFTIHLVEGSDDPTQILRDLTAQRQRVLGRQGKFGVAARHKSVESQTDPLPEPEKIILKKEIVKEKKRRTFSEGKFKHKLTPKEEEMLQEIQDVVQEVVAAPEVIMEADEPSSLEPESNPRTPKTASKPVSPASKPQSAASSSRYVPE